MSRWRGMPERENVWGKMGRKRKAQTFDGMNSLYAASAGEADPPFPSQTQLASLDATQSPAPVKRGRGRPKGAPGANPKPKKKINNTLTERFEQEKVVVHCTKQDYPFFAIPNAARRTFWEAMFAKRGGMKAGVPDLCFPVPRHGFGGLWVEMKRIEGGIISPIQHYWLAALAMWGFKVHVCHGAAQAIPIIDDYFAGWEGQPEELKVMLEAIDLEKAAKRAKEKMLQNQDGDTPD